jgi:AcrR family transcriptional regulator
MGPTTKRDREATRRRIIQAVESVISEQGFNAIGINAVARAAGVDKVLLYRYFGGLEALLGESAIHGEFWWRVEDLLEEPLPGPDDACGLRDCLATVLARHLAFLRSHPLTLEVIAWEMSERNELTRAFEHVREERSLRLMECLARHFDYEPEDFADRFGPALALLGAGANYLAAQGRQITHFNGVNLQAEKGWNALETAGRQLLAGIDDPGAIATNPPPASDQHPNQTCPNGGRES